MLFRSQGVWPQNLLKVDLPLLRYTLANGERMVKVAGDGKAAQTKFKRLQAKSSQLSLLEVQLLTGRTHQIRVHCQAKGHPVVGDGKYGNDAFNKTIKKLGFGRMFLHAWRLEVELQGETLLLEAPMPPEFQRLLR